MTYALSIIPDTYPGPDGKPVKVNKDDPNKFVIPVDDARRIVRAATRSAYAEVCDLKDLERANLPDADEGRGGQEDLEQGPDAPHQRPAYVLGLLFHRQHQDHHRRRSRKAPAPRTPANGAVPVSKDGEAAQPEAAEPPGTETEIVAPKRPTCSPEQKVKVTNAINAYVAAAKETTPVGDPRRPSLRAAPTPASTGHRRLQLTLSVIRV